MGLDKQDKETLGLGKILLVKIFGMTRVELANRVYKSLVFVLFHWVSGFLSRKNKCRKQLGAVKHAFPAWSPKKFCFTLFKAFPNQQFKKLVPLDVIEFKSRLDLNPTVFSLNVFIYEKIKTRAIIITGIQKHFSSSKNSHTGNRTRACWVKASYPNHQTIQDDAQSTTVVTFMGLTTFLSV